MVVVPVAGCRPWGAAFGIVEKSKSTEIICTGEESGLHWGNISAGTDSRDLGDKEKEQDTQSKIQREKILEATNRRKLPYNKEQGWQRKGIVKIEKKMLQTREKRRRKGEAEEGKRKEEGESVR